MPLEVRCAGCGRLLRVADEHAGKTLRCPACNHLSTAPPAGTEPPPETGPAQHWHMRTPEGQVFGPVSRLDLERWVAEGRVAADCSLAEAATGPWQPAAAVFPGLTRPKAPGPPSSPSGQAPAAYSPPARPAFEPATPFGQRGAAAGGYQQPHRGGLILVLALVGIVTGCAIFSLMAWVMGASDLREIRAGRMDRSGEGLTQAGQILGMVLSLIWILFAVIVMFVLLFAAAAGW